MLDVLQWHKPWKLTFDHDHKWLTIEDAHEALSTLLRGLSITTPKRLGMLRPDFGDFWKVTYFHYPPRSCRHFLAKLQSQERFWTELAKDVH